MRALQYMKDQPARNRQTPESFWSRVDMTGECWDWQGACNTTGYGSVGWHGRVYCAHRVAAFLEGMVDTPSAPKKRSDPGHLRHTCDNPKCVRPSHLLVGTQTENMLDMYRKNRHKVYRGHTHTNSKLTPDQVRYVRRQAAAGRTYASLSRELGTHATAISNAAKGRTYVNVE